MGILQIYFGSIISLPVHCWEKAQYTKQIKAELLCLKGQMTLGRVPFFSWSNYGIFRALWLKNFWDRWNHGHASQICRLECCKTWLCGLRVLGFKAVGSNMNCLRTWPLKSADTGVTLSKVINQAKSQFFNSKMRMVMNGTYLAEYLWNSKWNNDKQGAFDILLLLILLLPLIILTWWNQNSAKWHLIGER